MPGQPPLAARTGGAKLSCVSHIFFGANDSKAHRATSTNEYVFKHVTFTSRIAHTCQSTPSLIAPGYDHVKTQPRTFRDQQNRTRIFTSISACLCRGFKEGENTKFVKITRRCKKCHLLCRSRGRRRSACAWRQPANQSSRRRPRHGRFIVWAEATSFNARATKSRVRVDQGPGVRVHKALRCVYQRAFSASNCDRISKYEMRL